jgi:adenylate kinase family enzyme
MKIHIIGGSGSGKTYIATRLAARFELPVLDLDTIFWDQKTTTPYSTKATPENRDATLAAVIRQPNWIVEGVYYSWLLSSFQQADHILVLTTPLWLRQIRIVRRFLLRKLKPTPRNKESLHSLRQLLTWNHNYERNHLAQAIALIEKVNLSYSRCTTYAQTVLAITNQSTASFATK